MADEPGAQADVMSVSPSEAMDPPARRLSIGAVGKGPSGARQYRLLAPVARGGMGELYVAEQTDAYGKKQHVIVKRLLENLRGDEDYVEMFRTEAAHLARLDHPNIVKILDAPTINGTRCLALEYVRGRSVAQILDRCRMIRRPIPPPLCLYIVSQVLAGLDHVHRATAADGQHIGLVHRDVTPGNLLVSFNGEVKLTDFGIAKSQMSAVSTTVGIVKGKARYLSPEQILGERATGRSDIFSCGCVLFEMLTATPPFERQSVPKTLAAIVHGELPDLGIVLPVRNTRLMEILQKALAVRPEKRHERAMELAIDLLACARELDDPPDAQSLSRFLRDTFEGQIEAWEQIAPPVEEPTQLRTSDAPTAIASGSDRMTVMETASSVEEKREPKLRAASIAEEEAVRDDPGAPIVAPIENSPSNAEDTPASDTFAEQQPTGPSVEAIPQSALYEQTMLVRERAKPVLPAFPSVPPAAKKKTLGEEPHSSTLRIPEPRPQSDVPEGEEATLAVGADSPLENKVEVTSGEVPTAGPTRAAAVTSSEVQTEAAFPLPGRTPLPEPEVVRPAADRAPTKIDRPAKTEPTPLVIEHRRERPQQQRPPQRQQTKSTNLGMAFLAVFVLGALSGVVMTALFKKGEDRVTPAEVPEQAAVIEETPAPIAPVEELAPEEEAEEEVEELAPEEAPVAEEEIAEEAALLDVIAPRGTRLRIDGVWIERRAPLRGLELAPGKHEVYAVIGKKKRRVQVDLEGGKRLAVDLTKKK